MLSSQHRDNKLRTFCSVSSQFGILCSSKLGTCLLGHLPSSKQHCIDRRHYYPLAFTCRLGISDIAWMLEAVFSALYCSVNYRRYILRWSGVYFSPSASIAPENCCGTCGSQTRVHLARAILSFESHSRSCVRKLPVDSARATGWRGYSCIHRASGDCIVCLALSTSCFSAVR